ncbi:hypothetical protein JCM8547_002951 [Rhodosporidiobolus lusitaniae]
MAPTNLSSLYDALASLRLALPATLLGILALRWLARGAVGVLKAIQAQGWKEEEDLYSPPPRELTNKDKKGKKKARTGEEENGEEGDEEDEEDDDVTPVVIKQTEMRTRAVLVLEGLTASTYFAEGVGQVVATLITSNWTPASPLWQNIIPYSAGGLAAFCLCGLGMAYESQKSGKHGLMYPRTVAVVALAIEIAVLAVLARIVALDPAIHPKTAILPIIHLFVLSFRLLLLILLTLLQLPFFYRASYIPNPEYAGSEGTVGERTSLLSGVLQNGYSSIPSAPSATEPSPLRASRPPPKRPEDPNDRSLSIVTLFTRIKLLFPYLWPSKSVVLQLVALFCFTIMLAKRYLNVATPFFFGRIISDLSAGRTPYVSVAIYIAVSFLQDSSDMLYRFLWLNIEQYTEREMSMMVMDKVMALSLAYHTKRRTGELLRILSRAEAINDFFEILIFQFIPIIIDLPVAFFVLYSYYGLSIVGVVSVVSIVYVATSITLAQSRVKMYRTVRDENQYMHQIRTDALFNYDTLKSSVAEAFERTRLMHAIRRSQASYYQVYAAWNSLSLLQNAISGFGLLVCSFILARRVVDGYMDIGLFVTFTSYLNSLYRPLNSISSTYRQVMSSLVDTEQLIELLDEEKDIVDRDNAVELSIPQGEGAEISFKDVRFSYDGKVDVLKGISFDVPKGASVALVGPSGGGKSTIMRLLYRFYDVGDGSISLNGLDLRDLTQRSLRKAIGLVPQEAVLFNDTIRYNIAYGGIPNLSPDGKTGLTMEDLIEAAKAAALHDRIMSFPDKYETRVGERGMRLSGGEKQRVAIARTILKNSPILLLDEATSALDTANEKAIMTRLKELSENRTSLSIAHRLSTIVHCNPIHVLEGGKIVESGSHAELLEKGGVYAELWQKQVEGHESVAPSAAPTRPASVAPPSGNETPSVDLETPAEPAVPPVPPAASPSPAPDAPAEPVAPDESVEAVESVKEPTTFAEAAAHPPAAEAPVAAAGEGAGANASTVSNGKAASTSKGGGGHSGGNKKKGKKGRK